MGMLNALLDLLFPPRCIFCRGKVTEDAAPLHVCTPCLDGIPLPDSCCFRCAQPQVADKESCHGCGGRAFSFDGACTVQEYKGAVKNVIHKYKYRGHKELAGTLGGLMARQIRRSRWPSLDAVVPIPLHYDKLMDRGYDQALLLAHVVADELHVPVKKALVRTRPTFSQTRLDASKRWANVAHAFEVAANHTLPERVLLVDDLLTTGATAHFAAQALLDGGVKEVYLAVIGR